ncbi:MAG: hypothetical protein V3T22_05745 [Planctomycetota bacterium]
MSSGQEPLEQGGQPEDNKQEQGQKDPGQEPQGQKPKDDGEPQGNRDDPRESDPKRAGRPPGYETQDPLHATGGDEWGNLPVHVRELFRAEGGQRLPARYRDWIDSYYRRLNRRSDD